MQTEGFQTQFGKMHQELTQLREENERLRAENNRLEDENENLRTELSGLMKRVNDLSVLLGNPTEPEITIQTIRAAIQQAYQDAAHDDCKGDQILHMVWGFEYLLQRLGAE